MSPAALHRAALCPSTPARPSNGGVRVDGVQLTGIVGSDGRVAHLLTPMPVTEAFLADIEAQGRPEDRFRFAAPCATGACENWRDGGCGLIGRIRAAVPPAPRPDRLPPCGIRARCRWFTQDGGDACAVCPEVTYNP